ncbi:hypothetical protein LTR28_009408 [Elasticomyces elasticus]|nr:hypothetical protein LTR28_009408 [Elasticomyces elasticus]
MIPFNPATDEHRAARVRCRDACARILNINTDIFERADACPFESPIVRGPIHVDYGTRLRVAPTAFLDSDVLIADTPVIDISIGERTIVGAGVCIYGITHALDWRERAADTGGALAAPVKIGDDVWIGDNAVILQVLSTSRPGLERVSRCTELTTCRRPGVTVGDAVVIAPFTVVMEDVPAYHHVCGNPARVLCKVAPDVGSAEGLEYHADGIRVLEEVCARSALKSNCNSRMLTPEAVEYAVSTQVTSRVTGDSSVAATGMAVALELVVFGLALLLGWSLVHEVLS